MTTEKRITVAAAVADCLKRHGVAVTFSQSLPSMVMLATESLDIRQFAYRTENAGAAMADGYARITGKVGVVSAQNGPAATLLVPGLAEALKVSVPIVAIVQEVNRTQTDRNAFQEIDHLALFEPCSKWVRRVTIAERVVDYMDMAFTMAASSRPGPAVILLPTDLLLEEIKAPARRTFNLGHYPPDRVTADPKQIEAAADLLAAAKLPLVVAGGGVHLSGAAKELSELLATANIPVMTTVMGKGAVDENHPLSLGVTGYNLGRLSRARHMRAIIDEADVVLLVGTRTNQNGTDSWTAYPDGARYIHLDIDGAEVGRNYEALRLVGDAKLTLVALSESLAGRRGKLPEIEARIAQAIEQHKEDMAPVLGSNQSPVRPECLMADMQSVLTPETIVVTDASYATLWVACYLRSLLPGMRFLSPRGLAGLGWGVPLALGAKVARPGNSVLCIAGDGGFAHAWSELETARRTGTSIVITVLNNTVLAYQKDAEDVKFGRHTSAVYFEPVNHAAIARACGCRGVRIESATDYLPALKEALATDETTVIDVLIDPDAYPPITLFDGLDNIRAARSGK
ncbi:MAG: acetolactate synthase catalytic subunit [Pseudomonadota bacterium]|nr:acetolactate synthase catalytic subunit [Pseudomonadota bacterium]